MSLDLLKFQAHMYSEYFLTQQKKFFVANLTYSDNFIMSKEEK